MRIIVAGDRNETDENLVVRAIWSALAQGALPLSKTIEDVDAAIEEIVTGGARGVDSLAHEWAVRAGYRTRVFSANWAEHHRAAGPIRNKAMAEYVGQGGLLIAVHRNLAQSKGTRNMIQTARKHGLDVFIYPQGQD